MVVKIGHASSDENKKARGGSAGDQTTKEVCVRNWYNHPWTTVFRPKDGSIAEKIANAMEQACANDKIGYDQSQRTTLYEQAKLANWDLSKITNACECDCSALVSVCLNTAGVNVDKNMYTGIQKEVLVKTGAFNMYTDSKYLNSANYLQRGDILLGNGHTAIVLTAQNESEKELDNMAFKIALSAGHGRNTAGKRCLKSLDKNETREWVLNDRIADKVENLLKSYTGYELLRVDDTTGATDVSLSKRTTSANNWGANFYLAIHHNAGVSGGSGGGIVAFVYTNPSTESVTWQKLLYDALIKETGLKGNRSQTLPKGNLHECREPKMPSVLLELGFMDSSTDVPVILTEKFADQCAKAIVDVIVKKAKLIRKQSASASSSNTLNVGDEVNLVSGATYSSGASIPSWLFSSALYVRELQGDNIVISTQKTGSITGVVNKKYLTKTTSFKSYMVKITTDALNIRSGVGTNHAIVDVIKDGGVYTIIDESNGWGLLKSYSKNRNGWICLDYTEKI